MVGFRDGRLQLMTYEDPSGIYFGKFCPQQQVTAFAFPVGDFLKGRIINALGQPIDEREAFPESRQYTVDSSYTNPLSRPPIREKLEFGVKAIDGLNTIGKGQRIGIFAGSGVGKKYIDGYDRKERKDGY